MNAACDLPRELRAGDTLSWRRSISSYLASSGWTLGYKLVSATGVLSFAGTADGDDFVVEVTAETSAGWTAGRYTLVEFVEKGAERHTLRDQAVRVLPNLAGATAGADLRTHAQKVLDAINAWLESKPGWAAEMSINNRRIRDYPVADLLALRDRYEAMVANELGGNKGLVRRMVVRL